MLIIQRKIKKLLKKTSPIRDQMRFISFVELISIFFIFTCVEFSAADPIKALNVDVDPVSKVEEESKYDSIDEIIDNMDLKTQVSQLFIFGFRGVNFTQAYRSALRSYLPGAIIIFQRNIKSPNQIRNMNYRLHDYSMKKMGLPLLTMVDQEGGTVSRIKLRPRPPSALAISNTQDSDSANSIGFVTGNILSLLGFNINLAPVADLSDPLKKSFIGSRSFGDDPHMVKVMSSSFSRGLHEAGILPTLKHFPGHGGVIADSHKALPVKMETVEELSEKHLIPFSHLANEKYPSAMMIAHISFPNIDPSGLPSTFSKKIVTELLKEKMKYKGLIITDDIEMHGADQVGSIEQRAVHAFNAGCDMIMVAWNLKKQRRAVEYMIGAVKTGKISRDRIRESLRKIVHLKLSYKEKLKNLTLPRRVFRKKLSHYRSKLRSVTNAVSKINLEKSLGEYPEIHHSVGFVKRINVFTADYRFYKELKRKQKARVSYYPLSRKRPININRLVRKDKPSVLNIFYVTGQGTARILNKLRQRSKKNLIVINTTHPGMVSKAEDFKAVINLNSRNYLSGQWLVKKLFLKNQLSNHERKPAKSSAFIN